MESNARKPGTLGVLMIGFNPVVREGLRAIISKDEKIEVIGDTADGQDALRHIKRSHGLGRPVNVVLTETRNWDQGVRPRDLSRMKSPTSLSWC